jgi:hypothetical protein
LRWWAALAALAACSSGEIAIGDARLTPSLMIRVSDRGEAIPGRVMLFAADEPVRFGELDFMDGTRQAEGACELAPRALGTRDGIVLPWGTTTIAGAAPCLPPPGRYRVQAWQGIEFQIWEGELVLGRGPAMIDARLERVFTPTGTLAADLHVHARRSPDSTVPDLLRVYTLASAGIRVVALSDHNSTGDLDEAIRAAGMERRIASIASNELSSDWAHVGVYPMQGPSPGEEETASWSAEQVLAFARSREGRPIVQVNHPRYRVNALFDLADWDGVAWPPPFPLAFDAVEVLSSHTAFQAPDDRRLDEGVRDFYTLIDHGALVTAVGNSDTHHLNGIRDGTCRNYVYVDAPVTEPFDEAAFIDAVRARRVVATTGPWLDVEAVAGGAPAGPGETLDAPGGHVTLDIEVSQARFSKADRLRVLTGNGTGPRVVHTVDVPPGGHWRGTVELALGPGDAWIGVDVGGDEPLPAAITGSGLWEGGGPGEAPFALINPILVTQADSSASRRSR